MRSIEPMKMISKALALIFALSVLFMISSCKEPDPVRTGILNPPPITIPQKTQTVKVESLKNGLEYVVDSELSCHIVGVGSFDGEELVIPESDSEGRVITYIADYSFKNCTNIKSLRFEGNTTEICGGAFQGCTSLESVTFPESLRKIGTFAFYGNSSLQYIFIPESVTTIGQNAFANCTSLKKFEVDERNADFKALDGVLYSYDMKSLMIYPIGRPDKEFTVPEGVERINNSAFEYCLNIEKLITSTTLTEIDDHAFRCCTNLSSVSLFDAFHRMGGGCFYSCSSLGTIYYSGSEEMWKKKDDDDKEYVLLANTWKEKAGSCTIVYGK